MNVMNLLHESGDEGPEARQASAVELDFAELGEADAELRPAFADAIARAAIEAGHAQPDTPAPKPTKAEQRRVHQQDFDKRYADFVDNFRKETGYAVSTPKKPIVTLPGPKASYELWKRVIPLFADRPVTLKMSVTALTEFLAKGEREYTVTRAMLYRPMSGLAVKDAQKLLKTMGISITLKAPVTVVSIRSQFLERRERLTGVETFAGKFEIRGDKATVNGVKYAVGLNRSGQRRIRLTGKSWVNLEGLKALCTRSD